MAQPFTLPPLPFAEGALAPVISAQTIGFHYGKHHKTYVDTLNKLVTVIYVVTVVGEPPNFRQLQIRAAELAKAVGENITTSNLTPKVWKKRTAIPRHGKPVWPSPCCPLVIRI